MFAFRITDYTVKLNDSVVIVQVNLPDALPITINTNQVGILKHRYENDQLDTSIIGWGRCHLIKGNYYYFSIHKYHEEDPKQGNLLYTNCTIPVYYKSLLFDLNRHAINLTAVDESQFYHAAELFTLDSQKERVLLDSMVADIRYTGKVMKEQMDGQDQFVVDGLFDGKKLFDAMQSITVKDLNEFLKYMLARPEKYTGNVWKLSEVFATWVVGKTPQAIKK